MIQLPSMVSMSALRAAAMESLRAIIFSQRAPELSVVRVLFAPRVEGPPRSLSLSEACCSHGKDPETPSSEPVPA